MDNFTYLFHSGRTCPAIWPLPQLASDMIEPSLKDVTKQHLIPISARLRRELHRVSHASNTQSGNKSSNTGLGQTILASATPRP